MGKKLTQLDLCSGVGVGFPLAGLCLKQFKLIGLSEIDPYCCEILNHRYPGITNYGNIKSLAYNKLHELPEAIDIITASPPCQPFSLEGKRQAAADDRDVFYEILHIVRERQPKFAVIENVPGLLTAPFVPGSKRIYFDYIQSRFKKDGYHIEKLRIGSGHVSAPFIRERLLLVAVSKCLELDWERATPWQDQARDAVERIRLTQKNRGIEPGYFMRVDGNPPELAQPIGVKSGDGVVRKQRIASGNALDPRIAAIALHRILYLHQSIRVAGKVH